MTKPKNEHTVEDEGLDDFLEGKNLHWDFKNLKDSGVGWWTRILLKISPLHGVKRLSRELGVDPDVADKAHDLFDGVKRIDIVSSSTGSRGFQLILDQSTALYFYQDEDHFVYDGFEMGEYEKGEVTIFD